MAKKYLVVDDDADFRDLLCALLSADADVMTAQNGQEALDLIKAHRFDVILTDYNMPVMGGIEFLERAREADSDVSWRSILMTGSGDEEVRLFSERHGITLMVKPFSIVTLQKAVKMLLGGSHSTHPSDEGATIPFTLGTKIPADERAIL
jgi:two-component system, chemotaxis family, chemotaxis protein CheY